MTGRPETVAALLEQAHRLHRQGDLAGAEAGYGRVLATDPGAADAHHLLGVVAAQKGDHEAAARRISRAIEIEPSNPAYHCNLGNALAEQGRLEAAVASHREALRLRPDYVESHYNLGKTCFEKKDLETAEASYRAALEYQPEHVGAALGLAEVLMREGDVGGAIEVLEAARALAPDASDVLNNLGHCLQRAGRLEEALEAYQRVLRVEPNHRSAHYGLSTLFAKLGQTMNAKKAAQTAVRLRPVFVAPRSAAQTGSLVVLRSTEEQYFREGRRNGLIHPNTNNVVGHIDRDRWTVHVAFVDETFLDHAVPQLPPFDIVYTAITDADNCPRSLAEAQAFSESLTCPVINRPDRVALTTRDGNYQRLRDHPGLTIAKTVRRQIGQDATADLVEIIAREGFDYPVIVRLTGTHSGQSVVRLDDREMLETAAGDYAGSWVYVIQYKDCTIRGGFYSKLRFFAVDGVLHPWNYLFGDDWNVHSAQRGTVMVPNAWMQDLEQRFLHDPRGVIGAEHYRTLEELCGTIDLEYFGVDFTVLDDGELVVFEANPAVGFFDNWAETFPYLRAAADRIGGAFNGLLADRLSKAR